MHDEIDGLCPSSLSPPGKAPEGDSNGSSLTIFVALSLKRWRLEVQVISFVVGAMFKDVLVLDDAVPLFGLCSRVLAFASLPSPFVPSICSLVETAIFLDDADMRKQKFRPMVGLLFAVCYVIYMRRGLFGFVECFESILRLSNDLCGTIVFLGLVSLQSFRNTQ